MRNFYKSAIRPEQSYTLISLTIESSGVLPTKATIAFFIKVSKEKAGF